MNKQLSFFSILLLILCMSCKNEPVSKELKVLQFNIWQEGETVKGGYQAIISQVIQSKADLITFSEVRNYNNTRFNDRIVESLKDSGYTFYSDFSDDSGLLSRFPIKEFTPIFPLKDDHGSAYKALIDMDGQEIALYTCHLDYLNCTYYDIYGYSGSTWQKREPLLDLDSILANNVLSLRDDAMRAIIESTKADKEAKRLIFIGGDFNEPSHLDWIDATKDMYNHQGLVVPWTVSTLLEEAGFIDSYREAYPNPVTHPGFTFPSANPDVDINKLLWAAESDERERVDYIHYAPHESLRLISSIIWGPKQSIKEGKVITEDSQDIFEIGQGIWPTDHKAVLSTFKYTSKRK